MSKLLTVALFSVVLLFAGSLSAAVPPAVVKAAAKGDVNAINAAAAANPQAQGEIAIYLQQQAQASLTSNPSRAADLFAASSPFVSQIPTEQVGTSVSIISAFTNAAGSASFQAANPQATSKIFAAAINMTAQPNIAAASPGLRSGIVTAANDYLDGLPAGENTELRDLILLAQLPGGSPLVGVRGAVVPSPE